MEGTTVRVLFLSQAANHPSRLRRHLEELGCQCRAASCAEECLALLGEQTFDLLLSTHPVHLDSALITRIENSPCSAFFRLPVEDGFWWVPIVDRGSRCLGAPALRREEFLETIDRIVGDAHKVQVVAA